MFCMPWNPADGDRDDDMRDGELANRVEHRLASHDPTYPNLKRSVALRERTAIPRLRALEQINLSHNENQFAENEAYDRITTVPIGEDPQAMFSTRDHPQTRTGIVLRQQLPTFTETQGMYEYHATLMDSEETNTRRSVRTALPLQVAPSMVSPHSADFMDSAEKPLNRHQDLATEQVPRSMRVRNDSGSGMHHPPAVRTTATEILMRASVAHSREIGISQTSHSAVAEYSRPAAVYSAVNPSVPSAQHRPHIGTASLFERTPKTHVAPFGHDGAVDPEQSEDHVTSRAVTEAEVSTLRSSSWGDVVVPDEMIRVEAERMRFHLGGAPEIMNPEPFDIPLVPGEKERNAALHGIGSAHTQKASLDSEHAQWSRVQDDDGHSPRLQTTNVSTVDSQAERLPDAHARHSDKTQQKSLPSAMPSVGAGTSADPRTDSRQGPQRHSFVLNTTSVATKNNDASGQEVTTRADKTQQKVHPSATPLVDASSAVVPHYEVHQGPQRDNYAVKTTSLAMKTNVASSHEVRTQVLRQNSSKGHSVLGGPVTAGKQPKRTRDAMERVSIVQTAAASTTDYDDRTCVGQTDSKRCHTSTPFVLAQPSQLSSATSPNETSHGVRNSSTMPKNQAPVVRSMFTGSTTGRPQTVATRARVIRVEDVSTSPPIPSDVFIDRKTVPARTRKR